MCGITAYSSSLEITEANKNIFQLMHKKIKHRGPDESGLNFDSENRILLGHHRLSILDIQSLNSLINLMVLSWFSMEKFIII